jgi:predicted RNA polymerase sigma factor
MQNVIICHPESYNFWHKVGFLIGRYLAAMLKLKILTTFLATFSVGILYAYSSGNDLNVEAYISGYKARIEKAAPDDWKTFADCAYALVSKRIASTEAINWINRSIEIRETVYNRTVKGDFLVLKGKIKEGQAEYVRAIELAKEENRNDEIGGIQWKILISMGIENYNKFQAENK